MLLAEDFAADRQRFLEVRPCASVVAHRLQQHSQIIQRLRRVGMLLAKNLAADRERLLIIGPRRGVVARRPQQIAQVVERPRRVGMLLSKNMLADGERLLVKRLRPCVVAHGFVERGQVVKGGDAFRMVFAKRRPVRIQRLPIERLRLRVVAHGLEQIRNPRKTCRVSAMLRSKNLAANVGCLLRKRQRLAEVAQPAEPGRFFEGRIRGLQLRALVCCESLLERHILKRQSGVDGLPVVGALMLFPPGERFGAAGLGRRPVFQFLPDVCEIFERTGDVRMIFSQPATLDRQHVFGSRRRFNELAFCVESVGLGVQPIALGPQRLR